MPLWYLVFLPSFFLTFQSFFVQNNESITNFFHDTRIEATQSQKMYIASHQQLSTKLLAICYIFCDVASIAEKCFDLGGILRYDFHEF